MPWWSNTTTPANEPASGSNTPSTNAWGSASTTPGLKSLASKLSRSVANLNISPKPRKTVLLPNKFEHAPTATSLFPPTDPAIDGEDCLHDCESCSVKLPAKFSIDENDKLYGFVNGWATHLIVATGKTDWVRDVADEKGSVMEAIGKGGVEPENGKLMLSASNIPVPDNADGDGVMKPDERTRVLLLPAWLTFDGIGPAQVPDLVRNHINKASTNTTPFVPEVDVNTTAGASEGDEASNNDLAAVATATSGADLDKAVGATTDITPTQSRTNGHHETPQSTTPSLNLSQLTSKPIPHKYLIMMCSQKTRDARCGQSAPLLYKEFSRHLRQLGLFRDLNDERPGGVGMFFISHVGGHKYSANVMVYRRGDAVLESIKAREEEEKEQRRQQPQQQHEDKKAWEKERGANVVNGGIFGDSERDKDAEAAESAAMRQAGQCIWLARVRPEDCENIVKYTVLQGKVVKPERQLRGGFDRCRGLTSW